ncbi:pectin methylesterase, family CE8 [Zostera marina]|uniref:Pectinesterase n=1 Tax=Zostera marina TaxID=29655 RepID=A0A0K9PAJ0_ZOSMR|nr:pectin methylesterase, family CE8 [Zostera marina]
MATRQKILLGGVSALLLVAVVIGVMAGVMRSTSPIGDDFEKPTNKNNINIVSKSIDSLCHITDYKDTCVDTLSNVNDDNGSPDPKSIVTAAIKATSVEFEIAFQKSKTMGEATHDNMNKEALTDCHELLEYAIGELQDALASSERGDAEHIRRRSDDLKNWLSAVMAYQVICLDGLTHPELKTNMTKGLNKATELTKNALAITTEITNLLDSMKDALHLKDGLIGMGGAGAAAAGNGFLKGGRKLLNSGINDGGRYPQWFSAADRKLLRSTHSKKVKPNIVVAKDGSGNFSSIQKAIDSVPLKSTERFIIHVKRGVYKENVIIGKKTLNVFMYGDGSKKTIITGNKNFIDGTPTFRTATLAAMGNGFICKSIGFQNTAGAEKHQAVALRVQSDMSAFFNCRMDAYQDTLYAQTHRQFYRNCVISGTIDFIFGMSSSVFQNCLIIIRKPMDNQRNIIAASGRSYKYEDTGIIIHNCRIVPDRSLQHFRKEVKSYLGRPWKEYSRTIYMESQIGDLIQPEGWLEWDGDYALKTLDYAEYANTGPGANTSERVKWKGYHIIKSKAEALKFTVGNFLEGDSWISYTGIPFIKGLKN